MNTNQTEQTPSAPAEKSARQLRRMPTLSQGQFDNLKFDDGKTRVWLSRCGIADGMPYDNQVTVEKLTDGVWVTVNRFEARP